MTPRRPRTTAAEGCELVCVLGGDGTILRGAELSRGTGAPLLGVNLGHVGFLAEAEREDLDATVEHIVARNYTVEERMTLEVHRPATTASRSTRPGPSTRSTVEKANRERMLEVVAEIDGRPLSTWGCDGVVVATPTGSTAYAFSAGGPVVWPDVEALLLVPISAHALFARPLVVGPPVAPRPRGGAGHPRHRGAVVRRPARRRPAPGCAHRGGPVTDPRAAGAAEPFAVHRPARGQVRPQRARLARPGAARGRPQRPPGTVSLNVGLNVGPGVGVAALRDRRRRCPVRGCAPCCRN